MWKWRRRRNFNNLLFLNMIMCVTIMEMVVTCVWKYGCMNSGILYLGARKSSDWGEEMLLPRRGEVFLPSWRDWEALRQMTKRQTRANSIFRQSNEKDLSISDSICWRYDSAKSSQEIELWKFLFWHSMTTKTEQSRQSKYLVILWIFSFSGTHWMKD